MKTIKISDETFEQLKKLAEKSKDAWHNSEDFCPADTGNYDDVYWAALEYGKAELAEEILKQQS